MYRRHRGAVALWNRTKQRDLPGIECAATGSNLGSAESTDSDRPDTGSDDATVIEAVDKRCLVGTDTFAPYYHNSALHYRDSRIDDSVSRR